MASGPVFDKTLSLSYLGLPESYEPSPQTTPIAFLIKHMTQLPPHLLLHFSYITSAKERTVIPTIRNRRLTYANKDPPELQFEPARSEWPNLWPGRGRERWGMREGDEERTWATDNFLSGQTKHVGNLGGLLAGYEEEREAERIRILRRERAVIDQFIAEEEESSDEEGESDEPRDEAVMDEESPEEAKVSFERLIREQFIYGLLEPFEYEKVDWDESLDEEVEREAEERWFDEDEDDE
ncbi:hypothetical protein Hypma_010020 [Hypsizygus marmoreus]|uniref:CCD97-like C-terminal domain-containing protein n=1 Tax=Hypsizygus marmoreus TaxID=39966 RepID=A0A369JKL5_HYPMA|nr:hypothetical protein Hypma_010020 [Hypsizygus marmoreus]